MRCDLRAPDGRAQLEPHDVFGSGKTLFSSDEESKDDDWDEFDKDLEADIFSGDDQRKSPSAAPRTCLRKTVATSIGVHAVVGGGDRAYEVRTHWL